MPATSQISLAHTLTRVSSGGTTSLHLIPEQIYIIFVNGLGLPQANWLSAIDMVKHAVAIDDTFKDRNFTITFLTYDRQGQGLSQSQDVPRPEKHDIISSVDELQNMVTAFYPDDTDKDIKSSITEPQSITLGLKSKIKIMLVAHSIGVPLARLYINRHPGTVTALLALDSNMANTDFVSIFPDPDSPSFKAETLLPPDTSVEQLRWTRSNFARLFHPSTPNPENLDRSNLSSLLPDANAPALIGPGGLPVLLGIVAHDPVTFADESLKISTQGLTEWYMEPCWQRYNEGLLEIGRTEREGIVVAEGSGHFVQRDNPSCVAEEIVKMLKRL